MAATKTRPKRVRNRNEGRGRLIIEKRKGVITAAYETGDEYAKNEPKRKTPKLTPWQHLRDDSNLMNYKDFHMVFLR